MNRFYWPEEPATAQLLTDLAEALATRTREVIVITSSPDTGKIATRELHHQVQIIRVRGTRLGRSNLGGRAIDFITFVGGAAWQLFGTTRRGDVVISMTDPPMLSVVAWVVARSRGARIVHWIQDIYPEIAARLSRNGAGRMLGAGFRPVRDLTWRRSDRCIAVGRNMAEHIRKTGVSPEKVLTVPNWAPAGLLPSPRSAADALREDWGLRGKFVVVYSGNLGRVHDLEPVLDLAEMMTREPRISFVFIGAGAQRAGLMAASAARGLSNVQFQPSQPRERLNETLALGDVHLVTLRADCAALVFPSKLYGIAAVGRPVVVIAPRTSELAALVTTHRFGWAFERDEMISAAAHLRQLASDPARCAHAGAAAIEFSRQHGQLSQATESWENILLGDAAC